MAPDMTQQTPERKRLSQQVVQKWPDRWFPPLSKFGNVAQGGRRINRPRWPKMGQMWAVSNSDHTSGWQVCGHEGLNLPYRQNGRPVDAQPLESVVDQPQSDQPDGPIGEGKRGRGAGPANFTVRFIDVDR